MRLKPTTYGRTTLKGFAERGPVGRPTHYVLVGVPDDLPAERSRRNVKHPPRVSLVRQEVAIQLSFLVEAHDLICVVLGF